MKVKLVALTLTASLIPTTGLTCPADCEEGQPNPAADRIDYELLEMTSSTTGTVLITGVVENKGSGDFDSNPGQQSVLLYEGTTLLAQTDFEDLAPGETVSVSAEVDWSTSNEFPPTYRVVISYDPDIFIDGNEANDDCATSDNALSRDGAEINDLF